MARAKMKPKKNPDLFDKITSYDWQFTTSERQPPFKTKYNIPHKGRDAFRLLIRDYMRMEAQKDDRTYGFLDGALRMRMAEQVEPRFNECLKITLPDTTNAEYQAVCACGGIISSFENPELRQGYYHQMLDEIRHTQIQMKLREYYVKHAPDPAGWDINQKALYQHPAGLVSLGEMYHFHTGDPIDCIIDLNVIVETAFTNVLLVAVPQVAVANGDHALATSFLSIQSDESRHMANGYGSLLCVLRDEHNIPLVNDAIERHFWHAHKSLDAITGWQCEYGARVRPWAYKDQWKEWIVDDFVGSYIARLEPFGVQTPRFLGDALRDVQWMHHTIAQFLASIWMLNCWRTDCLDAADYEWFEKHYPGWTNYYGEFWDAHRQMADPADGMIMLKQMDSVPAFCQICNLPCILPRPDISESRITELDGKRYAVCSEQCEWILQKWPAVYAGRRQWTERYHGWDLADVILDLGYVRPDGKTLIGQPSLDLGRLWTLDDIRKLQYEVRNPLAQ